MLDRTEQRIVGVLVEKELSVPDSYPMTENALLAGCNQKSNRDPEMALEIFEIAGALLALRERQWVSRVEGGRAARYRHHLDQRLSVDRRGMAVLAELLLRGPQAPGELSRRVPRMGVQEHPEQVLLLLQQLAERERPLVEQLALRPRERERRWRHLLASGDEPEPHDEPAAREVVAAPPTSPSPARAAGDPTVHARLAELERRVDELTDALERLRSRVEEP